METMTETGTEKRIDELSRRVDLGFEQVDRCFEEVDQRFDRVETDIRELRADTKSGFDAMVAGFARVDEKFGSLQRTIIVILGGAVTTLVGGVIAVAFMAFS